MPQHPNRISVSSVSAVDKQAWLCGRQRWDLFWKRRSAIERDTEEWKAVKKAFLKL